MSQSSVPVIDNSKIRLIDVLEDEEAVIRVRTKRHISLVFMSCTIDIFEKDGIVFTRQEYRSVSEGDDNSIGDVEVAHDIDTQAIQSSQKEDIVEETQLMDLGEFNTGTFEQNNQNLEDVLEYLDVYESGDTQLEGGDIPEYTSNGIYIPFYLRCKGLTGVSPDSQTYEVPLT